MSETNKNVVRRLFDAWGAHDVDAAVACIAPECNGGGPEGLRRELTGFLAAFSDVTVSVEDLLGEGDLVASRIIVRGTHAGTFLGIPATGRPMTMKANHIFHCAGGRIAQRYGQTDRLELMTQLGAKP